MIPNGGTLNKILKAFEDQFITGMNIIGNDAGILLRSLATIELILVALWWAYSGSEALGKLLKKIMFIVIFIGIVSNYQLLVNLVRDSFVAVGNKAAGGVTPIILDPSGIVDRGVTLTKPLWALAGQKVSYFSLDIFDALFLLITIVVILVSYGILGIQVLITRIEFGMISTLGLILIPLGVFKHTAFIAEKVFGAIVSFGVKLMVLTFVISVAFPIIQDLSIPDEASWYHQVYTMLASVAVAMLALHAPGVAAGLLAGSPTLTAGSTLGGAAIGGGVGAGTAIAAKHATGTTGRMALAGYSKFFGGGASSTKAGAGGGSGGGGVDSSGGNSGVGPSPLKPSGSGSSTDSTKSGAASRAQEGRGQGFTFRASNRDDYEANENKGQEAANGGEKFESSDTNSKNSSSTKSDIKQPEQYFNKERASGKGANNRSALSRLAQAHQVTSSVLDRTAHPSGGLSVPIKRED